MSAMRDLIWTSVALLSFWRRNTLSLLTLITGLAVATALWSGVQALNAEARLSYDRAAANLGGDQFHQIVPRGRDTMDESWFGVMRRAGFNVSPVLEERVITSQHRLTLIGIDPLSLPPGERAANDWMSAFEATNDVTRFLTPPYTAFVSTATLQELGWSVGEQPNVAGGRLPPLQRLDTVPPRTILTDIGVVQALLTQDQRLTRLIVHPMADAQLMSLAALLPATGPDALSLRAPQTDSELDSLTDSFHLNLTAFGLLSFVVGLFIVNSAIGLAFEKRRGLVRTLRACGVSTRDLGAALLIELMVLALLGGTIGIVGGYLIASALLPDISASLDGLYGARVAGQLTLSWHWWLLGLAMALLGALIAAGANWLKLVRLPILANAMPLAWRAAHAQARRWQLALAVILLGLSYASYLFGTAILGGLISGFVLMGAMLLGAALLLPSVLAWCVEQCERRAQRPVAQWFWADTNQQISGLSLALMALLLALAINIGVGTMVQSFRTTFFGWLDQRLAAEIYLNAGTEDQAQDILRFLNARPEVRSSLPIWSAETTYRSLPTQVFGVVDDPTYRDNWPMLAAAPDLWDDLAAGEGVLVSEQLARRFDLELGAIFEVTAINGGLSAPILGIYSDYGNPIGQAILSNERLLSLWPDVEQVQFGLRVEPDAVPRLIEDLRSNFSFEGTGLIDQASLKELSRSIFERTFTVTIALNTLTLAVAGIAMLTSLLTLAQIRLPQLAPVWALGLTRRELARLDLLKTLVLALITALLAVPLGLLVAWILLAVINVEAFGWRLPLQMFPLSWLQLIATAMLTALIAGVYPALKLWRSPPAALLRVFANER